MRTKRPNHALAALALLLALPSCGGGGSFDNLYPIWVPTDVLVADIDGDGRRDIVTIAQLASGPSQREGHLVVRRQTAPGSFAAPQTYIAGAYPWKIAAGDINGDGKTDLVVADAGSSAAGSADGFVWMLTQDPAGGGVFRSPRLLLQTSSDPAGIVIGDMNGDGLPDLVVATHLPGTEGATILLQDAARPGDFLPPAPLPLPGNAVAVCAGDLDGNGRTDIVVRVAVSTVQGISDTALGVVYQSAGGILLPWEQLPSDRTGLFSNLLASTDLNGDGLVDLVEFLVPQSTEYRIHVGALIRSPAGLFQGTDSLPADLRGANGAAAADLDGDGRPDLAIAGSYPEGSPSRVESRLYILHQDGSGSFLSAGSIDMPLPAWRVAAGDLDGDGLSDLVVLGGENRVILLLQSATEPGSFAGPRIP